MYNNSILSSPSVSESDSVVSSYKLPACSKNSVNGSNFKILYNYAIFINKRHGQK